MKLSKVFWILLGAGLLEVMVISSCNSADKKESKANGVLSEIKEGTDEVMQELQAEVDQLKKEASNQISVNEKALEDLKAGAVQEKQEARAELEKKIEDLEKRNQELKQKVQQFGVRTREDWDSFKTEFKRDMDELAHAFKDLTVKNVK